MTGHSERVAKALRYARYYRSIGLQPLPSKMDRKAPDMDTFAEFWGEPAPDSLYQDGRWRTTNIQCMAMAWPWRLVAVDCDGAEALETWGRMCAHHGGCPPTWTVATGSGTGTHFWFTTPEWLDECPSRVLWGVWDTWLGTDPKKPGSPGKGGWRKHVEIRLLGDRSLVVAPPSIHVETGAEYRFTTGPRDMPRPAEAPAWLLRMPAIQAPACVEALAPVAIAQEAPSRAVAGLYRRESVLAAIPDKIALAKSWGLRVASSGPNPKGWWNVHAIDREDASASASFHGQDGVYWEGRDSLKLSLFDLAVQLGAYATWLDARDALGARFSAARG